MLAYLVIREGSKWADVFRLVPGRTVTIGRAATNQIVVKDERASRAHAEIFHTRGRWTIRDLDSRNGTLVDGQEVRGDYGLSPGEIIRVAHCQMAFVNDVAEAFSEGSEVRSNMERDEEAVAPAPMISLSDSNVLDTVDAGTLITHRAEKTKFLEPAKLATVSRPRLADARLGDASARLCRLAFNLANQADMKSASQLALDGLFEATHADAGAVLLVPDDIGAVDEMDEPTFQLIASRSESDRRYREISTFLASTVYREGEAVLARNLADDSALGGRDSQGEILSSSVICAPIRQGARIVGLVHLYSTTEREMLDPEDLEFTLAVADNMALAMKNLRKQQELAENLSRTRSEVRQLRSRLGAECNLIGSSEALERVKQEVERAAPSRATVLIFGESGVGKELVARAVHFSSPRKKGPFVCLNCAALSETLLESELFGHEKGAFTGATDRKMGKFEASDKGTLMLDEIGEMSPSIQAKFLRVLEGHPFERVGGSKAIKVDVRVIAATNRDLEKAVTDGRFRRDLFFRLHVIEVKVPPLRHRPEDVIELAWYFLERFNEETGRRLQGFSEAALNRMREYRWPGNVRELKNVVERAVVLAPGDWIDFDDLTLSNLATPESSELPIPQHTYRPASLEEVEKRHIAETLISTGWNKSRSAGILGIERSTLDRKIRKYKLTRPS